MMWIGIGGEKLVPPGQWSHELGHQIAATRVERKEGIGVGAAAQSEGQDPEMCPTGGEVMNHTT